MKIAGIVVLAMLCCSAIVFGQQQNRRQAEAQELYQEGKWVESAGAYEGLVKEEPTNALFWNRLGSSYSNLKEYKKAVDSYEHAVAIRKNPVVMYNLACAYARLDNVGKSLDWLASAAENGFGQPATMVNDDDLAAVRSEPRFKTILAKVQNNATPCANDPLHRQFDFWVGEWNVVNVQGQAAGTSSIQRVIDGCAILENWTGSNGYTGKSLNFVDPGTGKWRQTWVGSRGGKIEFTGQLEGKNMVFYSEEKDSDGKPYRRRLTFYNLGPDKVRQFSQRTSDNGKTWTTEYDLTYLRK